MMVCDSKCKSRLKVCQETVAAFNDGTEAAVPHQATG